MLLFHLWKVSRFPCVSAHLREVWKGRMEAKRRCRCSGGHGTETHLRKVGRYRGENAHLWKVGNLILVGDVCEDGFLLGCGRQYKKKTAAGCCGRWSFGNFIERKTGFEPALISLPSGSKSARVFRAFLYPPRPSTGGRRRSWGEPRFPLGCGRQYKKKTAAGVLRSVVLWELY